jgi:hypothetical protein
VNFDIVLLSGAINRIERRALSFIGRIERRALPRF